MGKEAEARLPSIQKKHKYKQTYKYKAPKMHRKEQKGRMKYIGGSYQLHTRVSHLTVAPQNTLELKLPPLFMTYWVSPYN